MEELENLTMSALEGCTYRDLQRYAKSMGLPSNVKKCSLIEMIHARRYSSREHFDSVVARVRDQRKQKQAFKPRKNAKKKKRVQGNEISSTSNQSPPISTTPQPPYFPYTESTTHTIMQCQTSILNPLITKRALNTDRILRSYNNKLKRNMKYIGSVDDDEMNINNTVVGVIKSQNMVKSYVQERVCEWNAEVQRYSPVRSDCQRRERQSIEAGDLVLRQSRSVAACSNQQAVYADSEDRQLVPARNMKPAPRYQRRVSGVYPLKPAEQVQHRSSYIAYRRQDGRICEVNTFIKRQGPTITVRDKMTQTTAQRNVKPIIVSRRDTIRMPEITTIQDIVKQTVEGSFSSSSTETAEDSSNERVYSTLEHSRNDLKSSNRSVSSMSVVKRKPGPKCYARLLQKRLLMENGTNIEQTNSKSAKSIERKDDGHTHFSAQSQINRDERDSAPCRRTYSVNIRSGVEKTNVQKPIGNNKSGLMENRNPKSNHEPYAEQNQTRQNNHGSYAAENQTRQKNRGSYAVEKQNRQNSTTYAKDYQSDQASHNAYSIQNQNNSGSNVMENQTNYGSYTKTQNHYMEEYKDAYTGTDDQNTAKFKRNQRNLHLNDPAQNIETRNETSVNNIQNSLTNLHTDIERDYPNMSGLSDVYHESVVSVTQAVNDLSGSKMEIYYHKKIRAEQVRAKRVSECLEWDPVLTSGSTLPSITAVFSQLQPPHYRDLTRPLYVDTGAPSSSSSSVLECFYNYSGVTLAAPLSEHHVMRTTTHTNTVYCTPIIATAALHESAPLYPQYRNDTYPRASDNNYTIEAEEMPRLQDYIRAADHEPRDITCDEVIQQSPVSSWSPGSRALSTEMEDVLDYISQDGDYMERIGMDVRAQCFLCAWAGPRTIIEYHVRMNHSSEILVSESPAWSHSLALGKARDGVTRLTEYAGQIYVVSVLCRSNSSLHADLTMLPKDYEPEFPVYGRLTMYNKVTGEPFTWEGEICCPPLTEQENETIQINPDQTGSQLINHDESQSEFITQDQNRSQLINPYQTRLDLDSDHNEPNEQNPSELKRLLTSTTQSLITITSNDMKDRTLDRIEPIRHNLEQGSKKSNNLETIDNNLPQFGQDFLNLDEPNELHLGQNRSDGMNIDLTRLDLLPNSANLMLINGEWVLKSSAKVVAGQPALDNIEVVIYVQILE